MMRTAISDICEKVMNLCVKCVGARGLNKPFHFERIIRDLTIYLRQPAPDASLAAYGSYVLENAKPNDDSRRRSLTNTKKIRLPREAKIFWLMRI